MDGTGSLDSGRVVSGGRFGSVVAAARAALGDRRDCRVVPLQPSNDLERSKRNPSLAHILDCSAGDHHWFG